nr:hypothetical protein [Haloarcula sp. JP-Z28]
MTVWYTCTALQRDLLKVIADHDHYDRAATADALQIAVETRREATLNNARVTDALAGLEADDLVTTNGTYALTDRGHDLVATDGGTTIPSHTAAATRLDTVLQAAEPPSPTTNSHCWRPSAPTSGTRTASLSRPTPSPQSAATRVSTSPPLKAARAHLPATYWTRSPKNTEPSGR